MLRHTAAVGAISRGNDLTGSYLSGIDEGGEARVLESVKGCFFIDVGDPQCTRLVDVSGCTRKL